MKMNRVWKMGWGRCGSDQSRIDTWARMAHERGVMKTGLMVLAVLMAVGGSSLAEDGQPGATEGVKIPPRVFVFAGEKEQLVRSAAAKLGVEVMPTALAYFEAARKGDWAQAMDSYKEVSEFLRTDSKDEVQGRLDAITSQAALEVQLALEAFVEGEPKYALAFGNEIVRSVPPGSIYLGGTDPGRGLPTALCASHAKGEPFFTLTQSALTSSKYRAYLASMYGERIVIPSKKDSDEAFSSYMSDGQRRAQHDKEFPNEPKQLLPGENVTIRDNRWSFGGAVAVMQINGILVRKVFDENPGREFFVEESYPIAWMYPHLTPHGLILKVNRKAPESISAETVAKDRKFWLDQQRGMIGGWLTPETSLKEVCAFAEKVFVKRNLSGFDGDPKFVQSSHATRMYSKLRSAIAGVYAWRSRNTKDKAERLRMEVAAEFAFRQAFAMGPSNVEVVVPFVEWCQASGRMADATLLVQTASNADPGNEQFEKLLRK